MNLIHIYTICQPNLLTVYSLHDSMHHKLIDNFFSLLSDKLKIKLEIRHRYVETEKPWLKNK